MKKTAALLVIISVALFATLTACASGTNTVHNNNPDTQNVAEISNDICTAIDDGISAFFDSYGYDDVIITVLDSNGGLYVGLSCQGMVLQVTFADYANALVKEAQMLAQDYDVDIYQISVAFTRGEDEITSWRTQDCSTGTLLDSYGGSKVLLSGQTIEDLVERYGAANLFYELLPTEPPSVAPSEISIDSLCSSIESKLSGYSGQTVTYDDTAITATIWQDGLANAVSITREVDNSALKETWASVIDTHIALSDEIREQIDSAGWEDVSFVLNIVSDLDSDEVLLSINDATVVYDVLAE